MDILKSVNFADEYDPDGENTITHEEARVYLQVQTKLLDGPSAKAFFAGDAAQLITDAQRFFEYRKPAFEFAKAQAMAAAQSSIEEAKAIISKLENTCTLPGKKDLEHWSQFKVTTDFPSALGVLNAVPGNTLLALQVQFVSMFTPFVVTTATIAHARASAPSRKERKISDEMAGHVSALRLNVKDVRAFMDSSKVKTQGKLFKDPSVQQLNFVQGPVGLNVAFNTDPLEDALIFVLPHFLFFETKEKDTLKSAEQMVACVTSDWEEDAENFMKMMGSWTAPDWKDNYDELLQPHHESMRDVLLNGSYMKVGKSGMLLNKWRSRFKTYNHEPRLHSIEFMGKLHEKVTESQLYCDVAYAATMILKEIPNHKTPSQVKQAAVKFGEEVKQKKMVVGRDLAHRLEQLKEGAAIRENEKEAVADKDAADKDTLSERVKKRIQLEKENQEEKVDKGNEEPAEKRARAE